MNDYPNQNIQYFYRNQISQKGYPLRHEYYPVAPDEIYVYIMFLIANYAKVKKKEDAGKTLVGACCLDGCTSAALVQGLVRKGVQVLCKNHMAERAKEMQEVSMMVPPEARVPLEDRYLEIYGEPLVMTDDVYVSFNPMYDEDSDHDAQRDEIIILDLRGRFLKEDIHPAFIVGVGSPMPTVLGSSVPTVLDDVPDVLAHFDLVQEKNTENWKRHMEKNRNRRALRDSKVYDHGDAVPLTNGK